MKKEKLNLERFLVKMAAPFFLIVGLFLFASSSTYAQSYVSVDQAKEILDQHVSTIGNTTFVPSAVQSTTTNSVGHLNKYRRHFGVAVMENLSTSTVSESIAKVYSKFSAKVNVSDLNVIRQEYQDLLSL